jgi:hypothetical protein
MEEYIVNESAKKHFTLNGVEYSAYQRTYSTGDMDVEVYPRNNPDMDVDSGEVWEYAESLFEGEGL